MKVIGLHEITQALDALPKALNEKVWSDINFERSKIIVKRAQGNAPEGPTGNLVDSIGSIRMKRGQLGTVWTGPRRRGGKKGFAGHLNEYGTGPRQNKRNGANRGVMKKNPFMARTFDQTHAQVESDLARATTKVITKTIKRYVK